MLLYDVYSLFLYCAVYSRAFDQNPVSYNNVQVANLVRPNK